MHPHESVCSVLITLVHQPPSTTSNDFVSSFHHSVISSVHVLSPQPLLPPSHRNIPQQHLCLLSVEWQHIGPAGSHLCLDVGSSSTCRPGSCAPSSMSAMTIGFFGLAGLPRNVGFTWVEHHHASAADLRAVCCSPALHSFG